MPKVECLHGSLFAYLEPTGHFAEFVPVGSATSPLTSPLLGSQCISSRMLGVSVLEGPFKAPEPQSPFIQSEFSIFVVHVPGAWVGGKSNDLLQLDAAESLKRPVSQGGWGGGLWFQSCRQERQA